MTFNDVMRIIRKRKWWIILSILISAAVTAIATLVWLNFAPLYTARAILEVQAPKTTELNPSLNLYPKEIMDRIKMSHVKLVTTEAVLREAAGREELKQTAWYGRQEDVVRSLDKEINVSSIPDTTFIMLSMTSMNKNDLPQIVNTVAAAYVEYSAKIIQTGHTQDAARLTKERDRLETELLKTRSETETARKQYPNLQSHVNLEDLKLQDLQRQLSDAQKQVDQINAERDIIDTQERAGTLANSEFVQREIQLDNALRSLEFSKTELLMQRDAIMEKFGPEHRRVQDFKVRLDSIDREITAHRNEIIRNTVTNLRMEVDNKLKSAMKQLTEIQERFTLARSSLQDLQQTLTTVENLRAKEEALANDMRKIDAALLEIGLLSSGGQHSVWIAAPAELPKEPSMPKWGIMMPVGILLGLIVGFALAFLLELIDTSIKTPTDVTRKVDLPILGMVPHCDDLHEKIDDPRTVFRSNPNSLMSEAFRQIHTHLLFSGPASQRRSLLVVSASPLDGRTTVAVNLAAAAARTGRMVLLVDTNFRQPMIHKIFPCCSQQGLSSALTGQATWRELVAEVETNFYAISAGVLPPNPADLLSSEQMRSIIAETTAEFDQVIFDGPPCTVVTDAVALSTMIDGVVLVVRAGANTHGIVQRSRDMFNRVGAKILGVVLNGVRATPGGYLRKNYEAFYEYHEPAQLPRPERPKGSKKKFARGKKEKEADKADKLETVDTEIGEIENINTLIDENSLKAPVGDDPPSGKEKEKK